MKPFITSLAYIPYDKLRDYPSKTREESLSLLKRYLTVSLSQYKKSELKEIKCYDDTTYKTHIGLPLELALSARFYQHLEFEDLTSQGSMRIAPPKKIDPFHEQAPVGQDKFIEQIVSTLDNNYCCFAVADTAAGKTAVGLAVASHFGYRTLVLVDQVNLAEQWQKECVNLLGYKKHQIAIVRGQDFNMTAPICIATVQSMRLGKYPKKFYQSFGMWIIDECHIMGAEKFSDAFKYCYATLRLGLTATPDRKDGAANVFKWHIGDIRAVGKGESMPCDIYVHEYDAGRFLYGNDHVLHTKQIIRDQQRNRLICKKIVEAYKRGRHILVIGWVITHLEEIRQRLINLGIPEKDVGLYTGSMTVNGKRKTLKNSELDYILKDCRIIVTNYQKAEKGVNIPRLDWGIDVVPRASAVQVTGRIRRLMKGKPKPEWHTILDVKSDVFVKQYSKRTKEYLSKGFRIIHGS